MLRLLTDISENHLEYLSEGEDCMMAGVPLDYVSEINMYVSRDVNAENPFPATDAFIASLHAEGVEIFVAELVGTPYEDRDGEHYNDGFNRAIEVQKRKPKLLSPSSAASQLHPRKPQL